MSKYFPHVPVFINCDQCSTSATIAEATGFCRSCQEYLCDSCSEVHERSKATKDHAILRGDELEKAEKSSEDTALSDVAAALPALDKLQVKTSTAGPSSEKTSCQYGWVPAGTKDRKISKEREEDINFGEYNDVWNCRIRGLLFLPNGKLLMTDIYTDELKLVKIDADVKLESSVSIREAYGVALLSPEEAVVTSIGPKKLQFVTLEPSLQLGRTVDVNRMCWGVAVCGETILVSCHDDDRKGEVLVMDHQGVVQRSLGVRSDGSYMFTRPQHIAVNSVGDRLFVFVSDDASSRSTVSCLSLDDGDILYSYFGRDVECPRSLLVDEEDNVYVCDPGLHTIQVVTKDGKKYRTLLTQAEGLNENPMAMAYRERDQTLVVCCSESDVLEIYRFR